MTQEREEVRERNHGETVREMFPLISEEVVVRALKQDYRQYIRYQSFPGPLRKLYMDFMTGKKTLPLIYDAFFKKVFEPEIYPERLEGLISSIIGERMKIRKVLPLTECMAVAVDSCNGGGFGAISGRVSMDVRDLSQHLRISPQERGGA